LTGGPHGGFGGIAMCRHE